MTLNLRRGVLSLAVLLAVVFAAPALGASPRASVTLVGHEGYLVRVGAQSVLFDGFLSLGTTADDHLLESTWARMLASKDGFAKVSVAVVSHEHPDHFDVEVALGFLEKHPETMFLAQPAVYAELAASPKLAPLSARVAQYAWKDSPRVTLDQGPVVLTAIRGAHEAPEFYALDVGVFIATIGGLKVLHAADAELTAERLEALGLGSEKVDLAFLAYSFLAHPDAAALLQKHVKAKRVVAMHLPVHGLKQARAAITKAFPGAVFFDHPLQTQDL